MSRCRETSGEDRRMLIDKLREWEPVTRPVEPKMRRLGAALGVAAGEHPRVERGPRAHAQLIGGEVSLLAPGDHAAPPLVMRVQGREPISVTHGDSIVSLSCAHCAKNCQDVARSSRRSARKLRPKGERD